MEKGKLVKKDNLGPKPSLMMPPAEEKPKSASKMRSAIYIVSAILVTLALTLVAAKMYYTPKIDEASEKSVSEGRAEAEKEYAPGSVKYNAIFQAGKKEGIVEGTNTGIEQGKAQGAESVIKDLNDATPSDFEVGTEGEKVKGNPLVIRETSNVVLGGFTDWKNDGLYVVSFGTGPGVLPYTVLTRLLLGDDKLYRICPAQPAQLCEVDIPKSSAPKSKTKTTETLPVDPTTDTTDTDSKFVPGTDDAAAETKTTKTTTTTQSR